MIGLMVLGFYVFYWYLCSGIAKLAFYKSKNVNKKKVKWLKVGLFAIPLYIVVVDYVIFQYQCSRGDVYFPDNKPNWPESLVVLDSLSARPYVQVEEVEKLSFIHGVEFDYIVAPIEHYNKDVNLEYFVPTEEGFKVYPNIYSDKLGFDASDIISSAKYLLYNKQYSVFNASKLTLYIYDMKNRDFISELTIVSHRKSRTSLLMYLLPYHFSRCVVGNSDVSDYYKYFFKKTFKNG